MLSSLLHNAIESTMLDRIHAHGSRILDQYTYPHYSKWTSQLFGTEQHLSHIDVVGVRTADLEQEWNMELETFIIRERSTEDSPNLLAASTRDACEDFPLLVADDSNTVETDDCEREETIRNQMGVVFREMRQQREVRIRREKVIRELTEKLSSRQRNDVTQRKRFQPPQRRPLDKSDQNPLLAHLEVFYGKFDLVVADLEDRQELIEIEEFKQLVIQDLSDRSEALCEFKRRLPVVLQELMQKVVINDLEHEGLLPKTPKAARPLLCDEWIELADDEPIADEADWIVCDDLV